MVVRIHAGVENTHDHNGSCCFAVEDKVMPDGMSPQSLGSSIARRAHAGRIAERLEGILDMVEVYSILRRAPGTKRVVANLLEIGGGRSG